MAPVACPASKVSALVCESLHPPHEICHGSVISKIHPFTDPSINVTTHHICGTSLRLHRYLPCAVVHAGHALYEPRYRRESSHLISVYHRYHICVSGNQTIEFETYQVTARIGADGAKKALSCFCGKVGLLDLALVAVDVWQVCQPRMSPVYWKTISAKYKNGYLPRAEPEWQDYKCIRISNICEYSNVVQAHIEDRR